MNLQTKKRGDSTWLVINTPYEICRTESGSFYRVYYMQNWLPKCDGKTRAEALSNIQHRLFDIHFK